MTKPAVHYDIGPLRAKAEEFRELASATRRHDMEEAAEGLESVIRTIEVLCEPVVAVAGPLQPLTLAWFRARGLECPNCGGIGELVDAEAEIAYRSVSAAPDDAGTHVSIKGDGRIIDRADEGGGPSWLQCRTCVAEYAYPPGVPVSWG